jgi:hypothetical protein
MASLPNVAPTALASSVRFDNHSMIVDLVDGRTVSVPLDWFPVLLKATPEQRSNYRFLGGGYGIHFPEIDEHISVEGLLRGYRDNLTRPENWPRGGIQIDLES